MGRDLWNERPGPRRLFRSTRERMWAGVAGGMAEYFDLDPTLMRLIWVVGTVVTAGLLVAVYFVMWVIMPADREMPPPNPWGDPQAQHTSYTSTAADATAEAPPESEPADHPHDNPWDRYGYGYDWRYPGGPRRKHRSAGFVLIVLGLLFLGAQTHIFSSIPWNVAWPVVLIGLGGALLMRNRDWRL